MKRMAMILIVLFTAATLFAGAGKECDLKSAKTVSLTGTIVKTGSGDEAKTVFQVANGGATYTVCDETKASILKLTGSAVQVKGKIVKCSDSDTEELVIQSAKKI